MWTILETLSIKSFLRDCNSFHEQVSLKEVLCIIRYATESYSLQKARVFVVICVFDLFKDSKITINLIDLFKVRKITIKCFGPVQSQQNDV